jgi:hypothetical protein
VRQFYRFRCTNTENYSRSPPGLCLSEAREIACGRESVITAVIGGEEVRIAHGGMMDFDPRQSSHIHHWTTAMRPISRSDSFDRPRFGIGMLERFLERWVVEALLEEQFGNSLS